MAKMSAENDRNSMASALCSNEYKVIIIGGLGAGKTSLLLRFVHGVFEDRLSAFVAEEKMTVCVDGCEVVLDIWDTAGQERFQSITNRFYSDSQAVIIVYDVTGDNTIQDTQFWVQEVNYYLPQQLENGMPVLIVGNKIDLLQANPQRSLHFYQKPDKVMTNVAGIALQQVQDLSSMNGFLCPLESSAKTGENVKRIFHTIASELLKNQRIKPNITPHIIRETSSELCSGSC